MTDLGDALKRMAKDQKLDPQRLLECAVDAADVAEVKANEDPRTSRVWADISAAWSMAAKTALELPETRAVDTPGHIGYMHDERAVYGRLMWSLAMCAGWEQIIIPEDVWRRSASAGVSVKHNDDGSVTVTPRVDG